MERNFILEIQSAYNQFTKAEKKVADYVIEHKGEVIYMSITDLADACKVGDTSVYRFCRTMKLKGYQEFKMRLSICHSKTEYTKENYGEPKSMAEMVMQIHKKAINESFLLVEDQTLYQVLDMMEKAERIFFFGVGDSLLSASEGCNKFLRITNKVYCITDSHMQAIAASTMAETDLILIVSYSGATKDNILVAKLAKEAGANIVCITHFKKSSLTAYANAVLLCGSEEAPLDGGSMTRKLGQLYLIDLLYQLYYRRNYGNCQLNNEKISGAVIEKLL